jgi:hypothetical protein
MLMIPPVKQAIAVQRILPFYKFFQKDINTPKGALVLHWVSSVLLILICPTSADGYSFAVGLFTYAHIIVGSKWYPVVATRTSS